MWYCSGVKSWFSWLLLLRGQFLSVLAFLDPTPPFEVCPHSVSHISTNISYLLLFSSQLNSIPTQADFNSVKLYLHQLNSFLTPGQSHLSSITSRSTKFNPNARLISAQFSYIPIFNLLTQLSLPSHCCSRWTQDKLQIIWYFKGSTSFFSSLVATKDNRLSIIKNRQVRDSTDSFRNMDCDNLWNCKHSYRTINRTCLWIMFLLFRDRLASQSSHFIDVLKSVSENLGWCSWCWVAVVT